MNCNNCKNYEPQPVESVDLGEWRGWKLEWIGSPYVKAIHPSGDWTTWQPGVKLVVKLTPECWNALLTAYRRAVARGLATWPKAYADWFDVDSPNFWPWSEYLQERIIYLGQFDMEDSYGCCGWPELDDKELVDPDLRKESSRRAVQLGLCEPQPKPGPFGVCHNRGCASQHDGKCFDDGSHFDPRRCTSRVAEPAPEPSAEERCSCCGKRLTSTGTTLE